MGISLVPIIRFTTGTAGSKQLNSGEFETYAGAHDAAVGIVGGMTNFTVQQLVRYDIYSGTGYFYLIRRLECKYDLSLLAGLTISSVRLYFPKDLLSLYADDVNQGDLHVVEGCGDNPLVSGIFGNLLSKVVSGGVIECPDVPPSGFGNEIRPTQFYMELNATGISWLLLGSPVCPLAFKVSGDKNNVPNVVLPPDIPPRYKGQGVYCVLNYTKANACRPIGWLPIDMIDNITATSAVLHGIHCAGTAMLRIVHDGVDDEYPKYRFVYGKTRYARDNFTSWKSLSLTMPNEEVPVEPIAGLEPDTIYYVEMQFDYGGAIGTQWCPQEGANQYIANRAYRTFKTLEAPPTPLVINKAYALAKEEL
ncbi:hypothetical protein ES707_19537 [subsurface metagenome]